MVQNLAYPDGVPLSALVSVLRSKNAGPFRLTLDIIFKDKRNYETVKRSGLITRELVASLYGVNVEDVTDFVEFDPAYAIKVTLKRAASAGSADDTDVYGAQQHVPLLEITIPNILLHNSQEL